MSQYFMPIYTTLVGLIIGSLVTWLRTLITNKKKKQELENGVVDALVDGMAILLRKEIKGYYEEYGAKDSIPVSEWEDIELTHKVYKQLHGNHSGDRMYEEMKSKHLESK